MRKTIACTFAILLVCGVTAVAFADHYATKADYRIGKLTPGEASPEREGSDDCVSPTSLNAFTFPITDTGDTTGAASSIDDIPIACNGRYSTVSGPDHIYRFDVPGTGNVLSFEVSTTNNSYDLSIYVLDVCGDRNTCVSNARRG